MKKIKHTRYACQRFKTEVAAIILFIKLYSCSCSAVEMGNEENSRTEIQQIALVESNGSEREAFIETVESLPSERFNKDRLIGIYDNTCDGEHGNGKFSFDKVHDAKINIYMLGVALKNNTTIMILDLSHKQMGDDEAIILGEMLKNNQFLSDLNLSDNQIRTAGLKALAQGLNENVRLSSLDLSENNLKDNDIIIFTSQLKNETLSWLCFSDNQIGDAGALALVGFIKTRLARSVLFLGLGQNCIGNSGATAFGYALAENIPLNQLCLSNNRIDDSGALAFEYGLARNSILNTLRISGNQIRNAGASAIIKSLKENTILNSLNLDRCGIHYLDASSLQNNTGLTHLDLSDNQISFSGIRSLACMLSCNNKLENLYLCNIKLGDFSFYILMKNLIYNHSLRYLDVVFYNMSGLGISALAKLLIHNKSLEYLSLLSPKVNDLHISKIAQALHHNTMLKSVIIMSKPISILGIQHLLDIPEKSNRLHITVHSNEISDDQALQINNLSRKFSVNNNLVMIINNHFIEFD